MVNLVSIIIPNYNHELYLNQRINSILNQTYQNFELIVLDDCSTDKSKTIIEQYRDHPKIKHIVYNHTNSGSTFLQWEKGIALATGDYIWIAESDDYANQKFLESLTKIINENSNIGLAFCGSNMVNGNDEIVGELIQEVPSNHDGYYLNNGYDECRNEFFYHPIVPNASAVLFKKENFYKVDTSFKQYKICGDWQFWIDICFDNYVAYWPENLNYFRQSETSVSRSNHYRKDNYKIFLLEKLKVSLYAYQKVNFNISLKGKLRYTDIYLFSVLLEASRKKISLKRKEVVYIFRSLYSLSPITLIVFFKSVADVALFGLRKVKRTITQKRLLKTA